MMHQHFIAHFSLRAKCAFLVKIFFDFFRGRGRGFCKYFASRGTFLASWNIFFLKKRFDLVFFAVKMRAFFVEHFAQRGTFCRANLVFLVKIFFDFFVVFFRWACSDFGDEKNTSPACFRCGRENVQRFSLKLFDGHFISRPSQ